LKIIPRLWLGGIRDSFDNDELKKRKISHIMTVHFCSKPSFSKTQTYVQMIVGVPPWFPNEFQYKTIDVMDISSEQIRSHFSDDSFQFIENGMADGGVLIHCMQV
jgi:hypothetical protein